MSRSSTVLISQLTEADWPVVSAIYAEGLATGQATFQTSVPTWEEWDEAHLNDCRLLLRDGESVAGWAALSPVSRRPVYRGVAEVSIYIAARAHGRGHGSRLLAELVTASELAGIWTLQAAIFPENSASVRLFERCGFRVVGTRERLGALRGVWRDVLLLERRSGITGGATGRVRGR